MSRFLRIVSEWAHYGCTMFAADEGRKMGHKPCYLAVGASGVVVIDSSTLAATNELPYARILSFGVEKAGVFVMVVRVEDEKVRHRGARVRRGIGSGRMLARSRR